MCRSSTLLAGVEAPKSRAEIKASRIAFAGAVPRTRGTYTVPLKSAL